eukprot:gene10184-9991_t
MAGETSLATLLRSMSPHLNAGEYVFCTLANGQLPAGLEIIGSFREQEGLTVIVERCRAEQAGLSFDYVAAWITLNVHSALEAVGLTAAFATALGQAGISCNVIAGYYHDHLFVGQADAERALQVLRDLAANADYINGLLVAFGLIMAIGTQNAFVLAQSLRREHHLPVAALCVACDALLVAAGVFGLATVLAQNPTLLAIARWGGAAFLLWYGSQALRRACSRQSLQQGENQTVRSLRAVMLSALAVTLLNPHVYLDTVLLIGSLGAQQTEPGAYVVGAASASLLWFFTLALGAAWLAPWLARPGTWRILDLLVAVMMFAVALQLITAG